MTDLCRCPQPLRDTAIPARRHWCSRCGGATIAGRRLSLEETARTVATMHSILDRLLTDLRWAHDAAYGLPGPGDGPGRPSGHSDPTGRAVAGRRSDSATWAAIAAQHTRTALAMLVNADDAAGRALQAADPHRGPADHVKAPHHDTFPPGRPDLAAAHAARDRRHRRGEL